MKKTKISYDKPESTKELTPISPEDEPTVALLPRKVLAKVKASSVAPSASASIPPSLSDHVSVFPFNNPHPAAPEPIVG
jgi:hypothetical protein